MVSIGLRRKTGDERRGASQWAVAWRRFKKHKSGLLGLAMLIALVIIAIFNVYLAPYPARGDPGALRPLYEGEAGQPPSWKHWFGTSLIGTDVYSDVVHASVYTVYVAFLGTIITMLICISVGLVAGYYGRGIDNVLMRITEVFLVFPSLLLILVFARLFTLSNADPFVDILGLKIPIGLTLVIFIVSVFQWSSYARVIRGEVMALRQSEYIQASKSLGASSVTLMIKHILPNILPQVIVLSTLTMAGIVLVEAAVSFLGFGDPNTATWGQLMQSGWEYTSTIWWAEVFPGLAVFFTVLAFNLMGDGLADAMNPRLRE